MHLGCDKSHTDFGKQHPRLGSKPLFPLLRIKRGSEQKTALKILSLNLPRAQMRAPGRLIRLSLCTGAHSLPSCLTLCNPTACSPPVSSDSGISRQEYWSGLPCPSPGGPPYPGIELASPALQAVVEVKLANSCKALSSEPVEPWVSVLRGHSRH